MPKTLKVLPKWRNFAKSGHTAARGQNSSHFVRLKSNDIQISKIYFCLLRSSASLSLSLSLYLSIYLSISISISLSLSVNRFKSPPAYLCPLFELIYISLPYWSLTISTVFIALSVGLFISLYVYFLSIPRFIYSCVSPPINSSIYYSFVLRLYVISCVSLYVAIVSFLFETLFSADLWSPIFRLSIQIPGNPAYCQPIRKRLRNYF